MKRVWTNIKLSPIFPLIICFMFLNLFSRGDGATNEMSRYATLRAMSDQLTFKINSYKDWTVDWAVKNGNIYSNKAPGPMLLGFPIFFLTEQVTKFDRKDKRNEEGHRISKVTSTPRVIVALFLQLIPFSILCAFISIWLKNNSYNAYSILFFALAALFGNTASLFMNFLFGHGMAAMFLLATSYSLIRKNFFYVGLCYGLTLLCEYTAALVLLPLFLSLVYQNKKDFSWIKPLLLGSIFPAFLWSWYHISTVDSAFSVTAQYQNPLWVTKSVEKTMLWGMFYLPSPKVFFELIFGLERGMLVTQPWVIFLVILSVYYLRKIKNEQYRVLSLFSVLSLLFLMIMNSSFNGWHGGATSGPRYLSMIFPSFALMAAIFLRDINTFLPKALLFIGLLVSLAFRVLVYGSRATAPEGNQLWSWLLNDLVQKDGYKGELRASLFVIVVILGSYFFFKKNYASWRLKEGKEV